MPPTVHLPAELALPPTSQIPADLRSVRVLSTGPDSGPSVVVLHGWGSSARVMSGIASHLEAEFRVWNVDLPGHGTAPEPAEPMDMEDHAAVVAQVIDSAGGSAHVIGHSNGGRIALFMASDRRYRAKIDSITLISPSGIRAIPSLKVRFKRQVAGLLKGLFGWIPGKLGEMALDWLRHSLLWRALGSSDYRALSGTMRGTFVNLVNTFLEDRIGSIRVPVLLFWGTLDQAIGRSQIETLMGTVPDIGLCELEGAGHFGFLDQPHTVYAGTRHFIRDIDQAQHKTAEAS